jgi:glutaredoxin 3
MSEFTIYTKGWCPYCQAALDLLKKKNIPFKQIEIAGNKDLTQEMVKRANGRTSVPQIFASNKHGDHHIGGCDDLYALEEKGELDKIMLT